MRKIKQVTLQIIAGGNIATIIILLMTGYSGWLRPETFPMLSNIGLLLPVLIVINLGSEPVVIAHGTRIAQMVLAPVTRVTPRLVGALSGTGRGMGGFGSTGLRAGGTDSA